MHLLTTGRSRWYRSFGNLLLLAAALPVLHPQSTGEYEVKAAFLYKFASFVEWPNTGRIVPLGICVAGDDPFGDALERVVRGKTINGREFLVRRLKPGDAADECQILFIGASERKRLKPVLDSLQGAPVLTVGDVPGFCESGGAVNFGVAENRVQLEINPAAAGRAGLQMSSRLLSLARIVRDSAANR